MARIEKGQPVQEQLGKMKQDMVSAVRRAARPRGKMLLGVVGLLVLVAMIFGGAWVVAATGLVSVPFLTPIAYHEPVPARIVTPGQSAQDVLAASFQALITERLQAGSGQMLDRAVSVTIPESALTASLRQGLEAAKYDFIDASRAQVSIDKDAGLEIFLPVAQNQERSAVRLRLLVSEKDGMLAADVTEASLGSLQMPRWLAAAIFNPPLAQGLVIFNQDILKFVTLKEIRTDVGSLVIDGDLSVQVMQVPG